MGSSGVSGVNVLLGSYGVMGIIRNMGIGGVNGVSGANGVIGGQKGLGFQAITKLLDEPALCFL